MAEAFKTHNCCHCSVRVHVRVRVRRGQSECGRDAVASLLEDVITPASVLLPLFVSILTSGEEQEQRRHANANAQAKLKLKL